WPEYSLFNQLTVGSEEREPGRGKGSGKEGASGDERAGSSGSTSTSSESGTGSSSSGSGAGATRSGSGSASGGAGSSAGSGRSAGTRTAQKNPLISQPRGLEWLGPVAPILKWIVIVIVALVILFVVCKSTLGFLANFTDWAARLLAALRRWWDRLFGRKLGAKPQAAQHGPAPPARRVRPFAMFANPFLNDAGRDMSPEELVRYTFAAIESWAAERDVGRHRDETPLEFTS